MPDYSAATPIQSPFTPQPSLAHSEPVFEAPLPFSAQAIANANRPGVGAPMPKRDMSQAELVEMELENERIALRDHLAALKVELRTNQNYEYAEHIALVEEQIALYEALLAKVGAA